ncbi:MAG TPA: translocation/assembly module TamB domain-containing protein [Nitrospirota bacterium]|nr:translocation/assembly module TamB domain-containing protein [Nitrospirota bacterium]
MKRTFIILAALFFVFLGAAEFYVQTDAFTEFIRPSIVDPLQELLGPDAQIGPVKANCIPPRLQVRDIVIPNGSGKPIVTIRKITVFINPLPLVFKKVRLPSITVLEPRITASRAQDGSLDIVPLMERISAAIRRSDANAAEGFHLLLKSISIKQGEIRLTDASLKSGVTVTGLNISSRFNLANDRVNIHVRGSHVIAAAPAYPAIQGELRATLEYDRGRLLLKASEFTMDDASISLHGQTGSFPDPVLDFEGRIVTGPHAIGRFAEMLKPRPKQPGPRGEALISVKGRASDPEISGSLRLSGLFYRDWTLQDASLTFQYKGTNLLLGGGNWLVAEKEKKLTIDRVGASLSYGRGAFGIDHLEIAAGDTLIRMHGRVDPAAGYAVHVSAVSSGEGKTIDFAAGLPMAGDIRIEGDLSGAVMSPRFTGTLKGEPVTVRGVQFNDVRGSVVYSDKKLTLSSVDIRRQSSRYVLDGDIDLGRREPFYTARLRVMQSDVASIVALFYKPLPLELSARGELTFQGTAQKYSGGAYLSLDAGKAYEETFTRAAVTASLVTGKIFFPQVTVFKEKGAIKGSGWISFDGTYAADLEGSDVSLSGVDHLKGVPVSGDAAFEIHSAGSFDKPVVQSTYEIENLALAGFAMGQVHIDAAVREGQLKISAQTPEDRVNVSLQGALHRPYIWNARAELNMDGIDPFRVFGNANMQDRVKLLLHSLVSLRGQGLDLATVSGEAIFRKIEAAAGDYHFENEPPSRVTIDQGVVTVRSLGFSGPGTHIVVSGTLAEGGPDLAVKGTAGLSLLKTLFPEVEYASGTADMQLSVKEHWSNPAVAGSLRVRQMEVKIKDVPQKISSLNGTFSFAHDRIVAESLTGELGGGTISASGWAQFGSASLMEFSFKSLVDNVTVRYPEGLTSTVSGNLFFDGGAAERTLSGDILIKRARYDKRIEWKSMLVDIGRGLYQKKQADIGWIGDTQLNVRFHGSDNIIFQNNLAQMQLEIDVFLRGNVNHPQVLGRIESRKGTVYFRKNEFKILHASADFADPNRMNPVLDIQAETQVREYLISLAVTGTADRASVTLISDPALADTDILSMLALGKKGAELKGKETAVGVGEAASFATGQLQDIFERRARSLTGLDRFQVDPYVSKNDTSVPRVTVGKELVQNKLFVTYSSNVGASVPEQVLRIEYLLNKHFSVIGERNEVGNYGADLKYRFEFR